MSHISSWHGKKQGVVWCVQMASNGSVRFGSARFGRTCMHRWNPEQNPKYDDRWSTLFVVVSLFLFFAIDRNFIWSLMIIVSFGFFLSSDEIGGCVYKYGWPGVKYFPFHWNVPLSRCCMLTTAKDDGGTKFVENESYWSSVFFFFYIFPSWISDWEIYYMQRIMFI